MVLRLLPQSPREFDELGDAGYPEPSVDVVVGVDAEIVAELVLRVLHRQRACARLRATDMHPCAPDDPQVEDFQLRWETAAIVRKDAFSISKDLDEVQKPDES